MKTPRTKEYRAWCHMKGRCYDVNDPFYKRYGGRGIIVCERWRNNFAIFLQDMGRAPSAKHSIDRINNNGNYEPGNLRWATHKEQAANRSGIRIRLLTFNGQTKPLSDWAKEIGIDHRSLGLRLDKHKWSLEKALTTPRKSCGRR